MKNRLLFVLFLLLTEIGFSQNAGLHFQRDIWQSNYTNPAFIPYENYHVALPSLGLELGTNLSFNDIFSETDDGYLIEPERIIEKLDDYNYFQTSQNIELFSVGMKLFGIYWSVNNGIHSNVEVGAPKDIFEVAAKGNSHLLDKTLDFGPNLDLNVYHELGISAGVKIKEYSIGARIKYLNGLADLKTTSTDIKIKSNGIDIYQLTATTDYEIQYAALTDSFSLSAYQFGIDEAFEFDYFNKNKGFAIDLGGVFPITDKLELAFSIIDLGRINWKNGTKLKSKGTYTYEGLDLKTLISNDTINNVSLVDTLLEVFNFKETKGEYSQNLDTKVYFSGFYKLNNKIDLSALYLMNKSRTTIGLHGDFHLGKLLSIGTGYYLRNFKTSSIGVSGSVKFGAIQVFVITESIWGALSPYNSRLANVRFGLNFAR